MEVTEEQRQKVLEESSERTIAGHFPEYAPFFTARVEWRKARIVNSVNEQKIDVLEEVMEGGLGDVIDLYIKLKKEEAFDKTLLGRILLPFCFKRYSWDRNYILSRLKKALNYITIEW